MVLRLTKGQRILQYYGTTISMNNPGGPVKLDSAIDGNRSEGQGVVVPNLSSVSAQYDATKEGFSLARHGQKPIRLTIYGTY